MVRVNYKQFNITKKERDTEVVDIVNLRPYILALKEKELGRLMCENCKVICRTDKWMCDIHHKRYGEDVNYYDLQLLCKKCHLAR